jgi:hypothetical protein
MSVNKPNSAGGPNQDTHHLVDLKEPPASLVALRDELQRHMDIVEYAQQGQTFEECLGRIALKLDIVMDGLYDADSVCAMLVDALRHRRFYGNTPHLRAPGLVDVEIVETDALISLILRDRSAPNLAPEGSIVTEIDTTGPADQGISIDFPGAIPQTPATTLAPTHPYTMGTETMSEDDDDLVHIAKEFVEFGESEIPAESEDYLSEQTEVASHPYTSAKSDTSDSGNSA